MLFLCLHHRHDPPGLSLLSLFLLLLYLLCSTRQHKSSRWSSLLLKRNVPSFFVCRHMSSRQNPSWIWWLKKWGNIFPEEQWTPSAAICCCSTELHFPEGPSLSYIPVPLLLTILAGNGKWRWRGSKGWTDDVHPLYSSASLSASAQGPPYPYATSLHYLLLCATGGKDAMCNTPLGIRKYYLYINYVYILGILSTLHTESTTTLATKCLSISCG